MGQRVRPVYATIISPRMHQKNFKIEFLHKHIHWKSGVAMMPTKSSLPAPKIIMATLSLVVEPEIVLTTITCATSHDKVVIILTHSF